MKQALTIAGSDSGGGAGIQADIKAFQANGVFGMSAITSVTAQNTKEVRTAHDLPPEVVEAQIDAVFDDFEVRAAKTGMLSSGAIVRAAAGRLEGQRQTPLVVDPVMVSKSGYKLLQDDAILEVKERLIPLATLVTPNAREAELLAEMAVRSLEDAKEAARRILELGCGAALVKGGHLGGGTAATDVLADGKRIRLFEGERIETKNTHGTGCTYSAAIAAHLALGRTLEEAVTRAKHYITEAIRHGPAVGHGHGPTHHFYFLREDRPGGR